MAGDTIVKNIWRRGADAEGNPLHMSFSREPYPEGVAAVLLKDGLEDSYDWHKDKQVKERKQAGETPEERALLIQADVNIKRLKEHFGDSVKTLDVNASFGENISVAGGSLFDPNIMCVGDVIHIQRGPQTVGVVQVSSPRWPCYKVNMKHSKGLAHLGNEHKVRAYSGEHGLGGVFCRVLQEGTVEAEDELVLYERPCPGWTVDRVSKLFYSGPNRSSGMLNEFQGTEEELEELMAMKELANFEWRDRLVKYKEDRNNKKEGPELPPSTPHHVGPNFTRRTSVAPSPLSLSSTIPPNSTPPSIDSAAVPKTKPLIGKAIYASFPIIAGLVFYVIRKKFVY